MKKLSSLLILAGLSVFTACKKSNSGDNNPTPEPNVEKIAPDGFNFATFKKVNLSVTLLTNNDQALANVVVSVYAPDKAGTGDALFKGVTNAQGKLTASISVPAYFTKVVIDPSYVGLMRNATANINNGAITATIGGKDGFGGDVVAEVPQYSTNSIGGIKTNGTFSTEYAYPTGYTASNAFQSPTNLGRPAYLEATGDVIDASVLSYVNASLPESVALPVSHPEYLNGKVNTINVTAKADVWVTFISEGAGYYNAIGYYVYDTNKPPKSATGGTYGNGVGGIDKITYIFPNASAPGSGGNLKAGDKVKLGTFEAGKSIGFVLFQNAWTGSGVNTSATKFYSHNDLNPESSAALRQHSVTLYDDVHKLYIIGFEDQTRTDSDQDFNDVVMYITSNPYTAVNPDGVAPVDKGGDTDGDGVLDEQDAFPNDPTKAFINYFPSKDTYATVAFEDNWPKKGDFDLNDMVVKSRYSFISNAKNQIVSLVGDYQVAASGASFKNGFGIQLPVAASAIQSVTGTKLSTGTYITNASNGVEAGQSKAVIIPFDNSDLLVRNPDFAYFVNTLNSKDKVASQTATVTINFTSPIEATTITGALINPFLISNLRRGYEVHLPGYAPTDKADSKLFNTDDDKSAPSTGKYYLSAENQPWAISFTESFSYPLETVNINSAYLRFAEWAKSGGTLFTDWYVNTATGYRNQGNIYSK